MKLLLRALALGLILTFSSVNLRAQTDSTATPQVEVHEGLFGMVSYFGGKLVDELATRLNLSSEDSTQQKVPTTVVVKVGGVGFQRTEMRAAGKK